MAKTILLVDYESDFIKYLDAIFRDNGYSTISVSKATDAVFLGQMEKPDLIILDLNLSDENECMAFHELRENMVTKIIPIIIVTCESSDFKKFLTFKEHSAMPKAYFDKPVDRCSLLTKVKEIIG